MDEYIDILREWERNVAFPVAYEHIDELFPGFQFRRIQGGGVKDHWASRYKIDGTLPKVRNYEKTVIYAGDLKFREQGDWNNGISIVDFLLRTEGLGSVFEFDRFIAARYGLDMPRTDSQEVKQAAARNIKRKELLDELLSYFIWNLNYNNSAKAAKTRSYLKNVRNFTPEGIDYFQFGFVPAWEKVVSYITCQKHYSKEDLDAVCQVYNDDGRTMVGTTHLLSIPYECGGVLKGFLFRRIEGNEQPKYLANTGLDRKSAFFNIRHQAEDILIVEGEMDALTATAAGVPDAVAIGGSEVTGERRRQIEDAFRRGVKRITLCLDLDTVKDSDGEPNLASRHDHIMKTIHTIKDVDPSFDNIHIANFDSPCDPDEYVNKFGSEAFLNFLSGAVPYWRYACEYLDSLAASKQGR